MFERYHLGTAPRLCYENYLGFLYGLHLLALWQQSLNFSVDWKKAGLIGIFDLSLQYHESKSFEFSSKNENYNWPDLRVNLSASAWTNPFEASLCLWNSQELLRWSGPMLKTEACVCLYHHHFKISCKKIKKIKK